MNQSDIYHESEDNFPVHHSPSLTEMTAHFNPSKESIKDAVEYIEAELENGNVNPLDMAVKVKWIEEFVKQAKDAIRQEVLNSVGKYSKGEEIARYGAVIEPMEAGTRYDYSGCGDVIWNALQIRAKEHDELIKDREKFLKTIKGTQTLVDDSTGEIYTVHPPKKTSTSTFKVTLPKT
jgi:hypothetical protein